MPQQIPLVTWMIPVLNGMPYLPLTLESIEKQTFKDYQVLLWDNGSTDGTVEEARRWIPSRLPGVVVSDRPLPLGLSLAAMVEECGTDLCVRIDADDLNFPDRLARQVKFMLEHPQISVLGTHLRRINAAGEDQGLFTTYPLTSERIVHEMLLFNPIAHPSVMFRRQAILAAGNYRQTKIEDYDLWLRVAARGYQFANLPEALVKYRIHQKSTTQQASTKTVMSQAMSRDLSEMAPQLYGIPAETMQQLRSRTSPYAAPALRQIALHLGDEKTVWRSPNFQHSARYLTAKTDLRTRAFVAFKARGVIGVLGESVNVAMDLARYFRDLIFGAKA